MMGSGSCGPRFGRDDFPSMQSHLREPVGLLQVRGVIRRVDGVRVSSAWPRIPSSWRSALWGCLSDLFEKPPHGPGIGSSETGSPQLSWVLCWSGLAVERSS